MVRNGNTFRDNGKRWRENNEKRRRRISKSWGRDWEKRRHSGESRERVVR